LFVKRSINEDIKNNVFALTWNDSAFMEIAINIDRREESNELEEK